MARTLQTTPQLRVMFALHKARLNRHHRDCRCRMYQRESCNEQDFVWTKAMNDELEQMYSVPD
jgi:hypothetical protein